MRLLILLNAAGGSAGDDTLPDRITRAFAEAGVEARVLTPPGEELAEAAQTPGYDGVVACGGDGTINAVANALVGGDVPLGVLPLGTLNHFARDLGLPVAWEEAVGVIATGQTRRIDVGEVNGRIFVNNSSVGLYAEMVTERDRQRRRRGWRKGPAMLLAGWRTLRRFTRRRLVIRADGARAVLRSPLVFIGNNLYETNLPNPGTRHALDKGELCLAVTRHQSRWGLLRSGLRAMMGRLREDRDFTLTSVSAVDIDSPLPMLRVSYDGEVRSMAPPLRYRSRPGALLVFAPPADSVGGP
ncbi:diacylglycerol kinase family protein [Pseudoroseomonas cervicalis]|uniref:diacylglycerol/lipid kinase family protein n=1 Tax=Teichococcus cervicalis TaxID=204525 RepID=UPI0022F19659|nr:diacylglycerol kinase family protein [Pseudoroseomonas cervicalis]WBV42149.1 diacylglycerol kinase family lipid kinase [Pseudoroseomonas cervicalis]